MANVWTTILAPSHPYQAIATHWNTGYQEIKSTDTELCINYNDLTRRQDAWIAVPVNANERNVLSHFNLVKSWCRHNIKSFPHIWYFVRSNHRKINDHWSWNSIFCVDVEKLLNEYPGFQWWDEINCVQCQLKSTSNFSCENSYPTMNYMHIIQWWCKQ